MPDLPGISSTIRCPACGFENATTSLYCQDCGGRLVPPPSFAGAGTAPKETPPASDKKTAKKNPKGPRILSVNRPNAFRGVLISALQILVLGALLALVIQVLRPPKGVPAEATALSPQVAENVKTFLQQKSAGGTLAAKWTPDGPNAYLAAVLEPGKVSGPLSVAFSRASVAPILGTPFAFSLFVERKVGPLPVFTKVDYRIVSRGNGLGLIVTNAWIGQLHVPAFAASMVESMSGGLDKVLATELGILSGATTVDISAQEVSVTFGPRRP